LISNRFTYYVQSIENINVNVENPIADFHNFISPQSLLSNTRDIIDEVDYKLDLDGDTILIFYNSNTLFAILIENELL